MGPRRAATTSDRALNAATIAAAEAQDPPAQKRKRGRPKKASEPEPEPEAEPEPEPADATDNGEVDKDVDWKDPDGIQLTWTLITAIEDTALIRDSLFPPVGAPKLSGGKPKSEYQYQLDKTLFAEHPKYTDAFTKAITPEEKKQWYKKIKNRLGYMVTKTRKYINEMGETGAGIEAEADIRPGTAFSTRWDQIKKEFPWFFHVRALIGERPNLIPTGLGNNDSEIDTSLLMPSDRDGDDASSIIADDTTSYTPSPPRAVESPGAPVDADDSDSDFPANPSNFKRKKANTEVTAVDVKPGRKKTKPAPAVSKPATKKTGPTAKPATAKDKFAAAVATEEETAQQALQVKQSKLSAQKEVELQKLKVKGEMKAKKEDAKLALTKLKMEQEHEYRMAQLQMEGRGGPSTYGSTSHTRYDARFDLPSLPSHSSDSSHAADSSNFGFDSFETGLGYQP
ncbi:hypothetical protein K438DRAFT_1975044 [Mycena galopus ATCC 62051]|nr:hypothetical protein K438DRAFT_1975044 [Mycena galopus ATCC 62051]